MNHNTRGTTQIAALRTAASGSDKPYPVTWADERRLLANGVRASSSEVIGHRSSCCRFAPTTGSLSKHRSRSSHHCLPLLLTETTHIGCFNTSTIIVSAGKVKGQGIICRKNIILLSESDSLVFHIFHRIVHKFQWITLWKEWKDPPLCHNILFQFSPKGPFFSHIWWFAA